MISGATHTGKTMFAQQLMETLNIPYLSIDHLKMGLIRSGQTNLTPESGHAELTNYLWPIVREMIKTVIENEQRLIVEGSYIPFSFKDDFPNTHLSKIRYICLVHTEKYIIENYDNIMRHANVIEDRFVDSVPDAESLINENMFCFRGCKQFNLDIIQVDTYPLGLHSLNYSDC